MQKRLIFQVCNKNVSWKDIEAVHKADKESKSTKTMPKITDIHISPSSFQKMRVKYATQIVAAALRTASSLLVLSSQTVSDTVDFIETINNIIDALNSRTTTDSNPNRRPLSIFANSKAEEIKKMGLIYLKNINVFYKKDGTLKNDIYCLSGFEWTIRAILLPWEEIKNLKIKYLLTSFFNSDILENFFPVIRNRGEYNPRPSVAQYRIVIQHNMTIRLEMVLDSGNCQATEVDILDVKDREKIPQTDFGTENEENFDEKYENKDKNEVEKEEDKGDKENNTQINVDDRQEGELSNKLNSECCSTIYVTGYLEHVVEKKFNCSHCCSTLTKKYSLLLNSQELFILHKDFSITGELRYLKRSSDNFALKVTFETQ